RDVHPGFFAIDYNDYYLKHCELLAQQLDEGEARGKRFVCMAPSHIPALAARTRPGGRQPEPAPPAVRRPRVLVIDSTKVGSMTATGQAKKALLQGWAVEDVAQIFPTREEAPLWGLPLKAGRSQSISSDQDLLRRVSDFAPEVIYYRPVEHRPELDEIAWKLVNRFGTPLVTHIMDDWPAMVAERDPDRA